MANDNSITQLTTESKVQEAILLQLEGTCKTKKEACERVGISTFTFDRYVSANPQLIQLLRQKNAAEFLNRVDLITQNRAKNLDAFLEFSDTLRNEMLGGEDIKSQIAAMQALLKNDAQIVRALEQALPPDKEALPAGPGKIDDDAAQLLLKQLSEGANLVKVTKTTTVEVNQPEVIEGKAL